MIRAAESVLKTDTGLQRRENEDSAYARAPLYVVADGMGGAQAGEVASCIAVETFEQGLPETGTAEERLVQRVREANAKIHERSLTEQGREGMGTTITAVYLGEADVSIAHVGDSRAYLFRDGHLQRLTQDHTLVDELVRRGKLTEEQAAEHPQRSIITRALGPEPEVEVDTFTYAVKDGDVLLLCSDGLTSMISEERVAEVLAASPTLDAAGDGLIEAANQAGGRDNITVVAFRLEEIDGPAVPEQATMISAPAAHISPADGSPPTDAPGPPAPAPGPPAPAPVAPPPARPAPSPRTPARPGEPRPVGAAEGPRRHWRAMAIVATLVIVLFLILGGGYLASRQLYFLGTDQRGVVTVYRGFPYDLPLGIHLYETYFVSGVPAALIPPDRRHTILNHQLRSENDALKLVRALELGQVSK